MELILLGVDVPEWLAMAFCLLIAASWLWAVVTIDLTGARERRDFDRRRAAAGGAYDFDHAGGWSGDDAGGDDGGGGE